MSTGIKRLAGETVIYGLSSILGRLLHFVILTPYLTRRLSQVEYGIYTDLYVWAALLLVLLTYRMETTFFRFGRARQDRDEVFSTASLSLWSSTLLFALLGLAFAPTLAGWLRYPDFPQYVVWFVLILTFDVLAALPFARLRLEGRPIRFALIRISGMVVNIALIFIFLEGLHAPALPPWIAAGDRLSYLFLSNLLASGLVLLLLLPVYFRIRLRFDPGLWRRMLRYALPLVLAGIAGVTNQMIGAPMLKGLASPDLTYNLAQAGIYGAAAKLAVLMNLFTQAFNYAAEPFFFKLAGETDSKSIYAQVAQAFTLVGSLVFLFIMLYLDVIQYFLGEDFREGLGIVPILLMANLLLGLYYNFSIWYKLEDKTHIGGWIALGGSAIVLGVNVLLIPRAGYYGPAWATLACYGFMATAGYWTGRKAFRAPYPLLKMAAYILLALVVYAMSEWLDRRLPEKPGLQLAVHTAWLIAFAGLLLWWERSRLRLFFRKGNG